MKFLHVADLHIGKYLNQKSLIEDQKHILNQILEMMKTNNVGTLMISGDVYDRQIPSGEAVAIFNEFLVEAILQRHYQIYMITGNHDSIERLNFASSILKSEGLIIESFIKSPLSSYQIEDEFGPINIYMMPFCTPLYARVNFNIEVRTYAEMIKYFIENTKIDYQQRNILMTHHTVLHNNTALISDSETSVNIGGTEGIEGKFFKNFDYVALGHLHNPQYISKETIRYSGSPLKYSESEAAYSKEAVLIELNEKNKIIIKTINFTPLHDLKKVEGNLEDLLKNPSDQDFDYIYFTLTNDQIIPNAMKRLRVKYPNAISLSYKNMVTNFENNNIKISTNFHQLSYSEQFSEFYQAVTNKELNGNQQEILNEIIKKVVNFDETN